MVGSQPPKPPGKSKVSCYLIKLSLILETLGDGAKIPIRLGFGDIDGVSGRYWGNPSIADSGEGQVMEW